jgi:hypothetical protein
MQQWEYLFVQIAFDALSGSVKAKIANNKQLPNWRGNPSFAEYCNQLGHQGWELVSTSMWGTYIFKRPVIYPA